MTVLNLSVQAGGEGVKAGETPLHAEKCVSQDSPTRNRKTSK